ncbi:MAG: hypothetical protein S4CHLAM6_01420 [Chlamydiae bacterium]|nr:hypothetical protein [Chlamydiota bacterium]
MLKLIYSLSDKEITLKFDKRRLFWTKELLLALAISVCIHFLSLGVFHIKALKPRNEIVLKPSKVFTEINASSMHAPQIQMDEYGFIQTMPTPPKSLFSVNKSNVSYDKPLIFLDEKNNGISFNNNFDSFEANQYIAPLPVLEVYRTIFPIQVAASDSLENRLAPMKTKAKRVPISSTETLHCKFSVDVEDRTGKVFYAELIASSGYSKYDHYAEKIIKNLSFSKEKGSFSTKGELDLLIEADRRDIYD